MALDYLVRSSLKKVKRFMGAALASLTISCGGCNDSSLQDADPCVLPQTALLEEICNDGIDNNCNGIQDENCDNDGDGYCNWYSSFMYKRDVAPTACPKSYEKCTTDGCSDGTYNCSQSFSAEQIALCYQFEPDCYDDNPNAYPHALEMCNNFDDNCSGEADESFPEQGEICGEEKAGIGICRPGRYVACQNGEKICGDGFVKANGTETCDGQDDDCNPQTLETVLTDARECYFDDLGNRLPLDHLTINPPKGVCMKGIELCVNGEVGSDKVCHGATLPKTEICDCFDNDCDDEVDENLHILIKLQFGIAYDRSQSMQGYIDDHRRELSNLPKPCFSDELLGMSTISIGDRDASGNLVLAPVLKRARVSFEVFSSAFRSDIPAANGPNDEPTLNTVVYTACAILETNAPLYTLTSQQETLCAQIRPYNTLRDPQNPVYDRDAKKVMIVISDEPAQWVAPSLSVPQRVMVQDAADLAHAAGMEVIIFTERGNNTQNEWNDGRGNFLQGYARFTIATDDGKVWGAVENIANPNFAKRIEEIMINKYCLR